MNHYLGLIVLGLIIVLTIIALYVVSCRMEKRKREKYEKTYLTLKFLVEYGIDDPVMCKNMRRMFTEIADMPYCNREKLQVLEHNFYKKFANENTCENYFYCDRDTCFNLVL